MKYCLFKNGILISWGYEINPILYIYICHVYMYNIWVASLWKTLQPTRGRVFFIARTLRFLQASVSHNITSTCWLPPLTEPCECSAEIPQECVCFFFFGGGVLRWPGSFNQKQITWSRQNLGPLLKVLIFSELHLRHEVLWWHRKSKAIALVSYIKTPPNLKGRSGYKGRWTKDLAQVVMIHLGFWAPPERKCHRNRWNTPCCKVNFAKNSRLIPRICFFDAWKM